MRQPMSGAETGGPLVLAGSPADVLGSMDPGILSAPERRRAAALRHRADRDAYVAAHLLARECVAALTGRPSDAVLLVQRCPVCGATDHGRPSVADRPEIHVSLAHTRGAVVAGADHRPLGVDVETVPVAGVDPAVLGIALTAAEAARVAAAEDPSIEFLRYWVRKESLLKVGVTSLDTFTDIDLGRAPDLRADDGRTAIRWEGRHVVDVIDRRLDAVLAAACSAPAVIRRFTRPVPPDPRGAGGRDGLTYSGAVRQVDGRAAG